MRIQSRCVGPVIAATGVGEGGVAGAGTDEAVAAVGAGAAAAGTGALLCAGGLSVAPAWTLSGLLLLDLLAGLVAVEVGAAAEGTVLTGSFVVAAKT
ncbi:MAG: hypothetical protein A2091_00635 [Desulfuromonadales bacterium GWD2_61_12]|nr:MAG: hypothetical protein A2091_00635 [Desulfuromonadales bacterium GWD2_61_12]OGR34021.1 MAG: hypothetical protein A2005_03185 [Desulfuromonadales bacterium GWC2_61_20]HAD05445.1 hypothetical protein [Desulfuromonas sp.]